MRRACFCRRRWDAAVGTRPRTSRDHRGRTVAEATEPACTGVTGRVHAFPGQFTPALETADE